MTCECLSARSTILDKDQGTTNDNLTFSCQLLQKSKSYIAFKLSCVIPSSVAENVERSQELLLPVTSGIYDK